MVETRGDFYSMSEAMAVKVKWKTKNNLLPTMEAAVRQLNGRKVTVGVSGADNAYLAMIHEYGCKIQVTDKMRAYLHQHGLHLKAGTEYITIPERSFLRNGYDQNVIRCWPAQERLWML